VELLVGEGDGRLKSHCVCPYEGSCLQKVKTDAGSGHGLSCVEVETSKVDSRRPDPLHPRSVRYFCFDYGALNCVQEEKWRIVGAFFAGSVPRDRRRTPSHADQREIARTPGGVLYASGAAVVIRRSADHKCGARRCSF